jgi:hypothetical protein
VQDYGNAARTRVRVLLFYDSSFVQITREVRGSMPARRSAHRLRHPNPILALSNSVPQLKLKLSGHPEELQPTDFLDRTQSLRVATYSSTGCKKSKSSRLEIVWSDATAVGRSPIRSLITMTSQSFLNKSTCQMIYRWNR